MVQRNPAPAGPRRGPPGQRPRTGGRRFFPARRRVCGFCVEKVKVIDYKDVSLMTRFINERARISTRRSSGTCAKHQRVLAQAIKRARHLALIPFVAEQPRDVGRRSY